MGLLITIEPSPPGTSYPKWRTKRSDTRTGTFNNINTSTIETEGLSYYDADGTSTSWYKTEYLNENEGTSFDTSDAFQPQSEKYTSVRAIEKFLRLPTLTDTSNPTIQDIVEIIEDMQDKIDQKTNHAWRLRYSGTKSGHDQTPQYEYYDIASTYDYHTGKSVYLKHRKIKTLDSTEGDVFEWWDGSNWVDVLTDWTEDRGGDFWVNYQMGIMFIRRRYSINKTHSIRLKYRYGEEAVSRMVRRLCTKMVAVEGLYGESKAVFLQDGTTNMNHAQKVTEWQEDIDSTLHSLKEFQVPTKFR